MSRRDYSQLSFADILATHGTRPRPRLSRLDEIGALLNWKLIDPLLDGVHALKRGGQAYPPLCMVKALLLAQWHDLSDPKLEDALADRLSFRRFCGFALGDETPDETSFVRFRGKLREFGLYEQLFAEINRQLEGLGLVVKKGTLVDATIIDARARRPRREEGEVSAVDPQAGFTKKHGKSYFGYKMHVGVDEGSGLIRSVMASSADLHDGEAFGALVMGDEAAAYGDSAYGSQKNRDFLKALGIKDQLMYKASKDKPLKPWQKWFNRAVSSIRAAVERPFGTGKTSYGLAKTRYFGEERVEADCYAFAMAYNLRRAHSLTR